MKPFTESGDAALERLIGDEMKALAEGLRSRVRGIHSIVLAGGYGRGEGGVIQEGGRSLPYNDYDLVLIFHPEAPVPDLKLLARELLPGLSVRLLDLRALRLGDLGGLKPTMFHLDLKAGSRVLDGDPGVLDRIPDFGPASLPLEEAATLLKNRMVTYLEAFPGDPPPGEEARSFSLRQTSKVMMACVDADLIQEGDYATAYREKVLRYSRSPRDPSRADLASRALAIRRGTLGLTSEALDFWTRVGRVYKEKILEVYSRLRGRTVTGGTLPWALILRELRRPGAWLKALLRGRSLTAIEAAEASLLFSGPKSPVRWNELRARTVAAWYARTH